MQHQQHAEEQCLLGSLCPGQKKLEGKTFYLDGVKKRSTSLLLEAISLLGGVSLQEDCGGMPVLSQLIVVYTQNFLSGFHLCSKF